MRYLLITLMTVAGLSACTSKSGSTRLKSGSVGKLISKDTNKDDRSSDKSTDATAENGASADTPATVVNWDDVPTISTPAADKRTYTEILCEEGLKVANAPKKDDFTNIFNVICKDGDVTEVFNKSITDAYAGQGEPIVNLISSSTDSSYLTKLMFIYTIEAPINTPTEFQELKIFEKLQEEGVSDATSRLVMKVESRKAFPGKASVEEVVLEQRIQLAAGAALYDIRRTELNNYLLVEHTRDINITTEHLLDADTNQHYHIARGLLVGMKGVVPGSTNLVYVTELEIKNRIDPTRLQKTVLGLAKIIQEKIYTRTSEPKQ